MSCVHCRTICREAPGCTATPTGAGENQRRVDAPTKHADRRRQCFLIRFEEVGDYGWEGRQRNSTRLAWRSASECCESWQQTITPHARLSFATSTCLWTLFYVMFLVLNIDCSPRRELSLLYFLIAVMLYAYTTNMCSNVNILTMIS
jgi:hypothetical protein